MQSVLDVGIDVASKGVVVACAADSFAPRTLANTAAILRKWVATLPAGSRLGVEATGRFHEPVVAAAQAAGLTVFVLNARDVKRYAQGIGRRGKTDRVDAQEIARYVAREHDRLQPYRMPSPAERQLSELLKRRRKLMALCASMRQSWHGIDGCTGELRSVLQAYARMRAKIDALIAAALAQLPQTAARQGQIRAVPGYGPLTSVALAHALGRFPFRNGDAFIAYTGLDPRPDDSGSRHGRRRLSKRGPAELRHALHMSAMAAARLPAWRPYYQAQRAKGLSGTASLVILARKMARTAYAICKTGAALEPERIMRAT